MKSFKYFTVLLLVTVGFSWQAVAAQPTFADLSVLLAKGYFKNSVSADASLEQCVAFLNGHGICFSLFDLMDPQAVVTREDFARVVGQSTLLFLGEAERVGGCIRKPLGSESWVDYCLLNDVGLDFLWEGFVRRIENGPLQEVQIFFVNGPATGDKK